MYAQTAGGLPRGRFLYSVKVLKEQLLLEARVHVAPALPIPVALAHYSCLKSLVDAQVPRVPQVFLKSFGRG